jgi:hypothetical protein
MTFERAWANAIVIAGTVLTVLLLGAGFLVGRGM